MKKETGKRGRPKGSKNKKAFSCDGVAERYANMFIATYSIAYAEQLAVRILEKIRASKANLNEKYPT